MLTSKSLQFINNAMKDFKTTTITVKKTVLIAHGLKKRRDKYKVTLRVLAEKAGVSPAFICRVEKGLRFPSQKTAKKITEALDDLI